MPSRPVLLMAAPTAIVASQLIINELSFTLPKAAVLYAKIGHSQDASVNVVLTSESKQTAHNFTGPTSVAVIPLSLEQFTANAVSLFIFTSKSDFKAGKPSASWQIGPSNFKLRHFSSGITLDSSDGVIGIIQLYVHAPLLLSEQLRDKSTSKIAIDELNLIPSSSQRFMDYIGTQQVAECLSSLTKRSIKPKSRHLPLVDSLKQTWASILESPKLLSRVFTLVPDLDQQLWAYIVADKVSHPHNYGLIVSILKPLTTKKGAALLLQHLCEAFSASAKQAANPLHQRFLMHLVSLITYYDPKYINVLATKTTLLPDLRTALDASLANFSSELFDSLVALINFFGTESVTKLKEAGIFDSLQKFSANASDAASHLLVEHTLRNFGVEGNFVDMVVTIHSNPDIRVQLQLLDSVEKSIATNTFPTETADRLRIATALIKFISSPSEILRKRVIPLVPHFKLSFLEMSECGFIEKYTCLLRNFAPSTAPSLQFCFGEIIEHLVILGEVASNVPKDVIEAIEKAKIFAALFLGAEKSVGNDSFVVQATVWLSFYAGLPADQWTLETHETVAKLLEVLDTQARLDNSGFLRYLRWWGVQMTRLALWLRKVTSAEPVGDLLSSESQGKIKTLCQLWFSDLIMNRNTTRFIPDVVAIGHNKSSIDACYQLFRLFWRGYVVHEVSENVQKVLVRKPPLEVGFSKALVEAVQCLMHEDTRKRWIMQTLLAIPDVADGTDRAQFDLALYLYTLLSANRLGSTSSIAYVKEPLQLSAMLSHLVESLVIENREEGEDLPPTYDLDVARLSSTPPKLLLDLLAHLPTDNSVTSPINDRWLQWWMRAKLVSFIVCAPHGTKALKTHIVMMIPRYKDNLFVPLTKEQEEALLPVEKVLRQVMKNLPILLMDAAEQELHNIVWRDSLPTAKQLEGFLDVLTMAWSKCKSSYRQDRSEVKKIRLVLLLSMLLGTLTIWDAPPVKDQRLKKTSLLIQDKSYLGRYKFPSNSAIVEVLSDCEEDSYLLHMTPQYQRLGCAPDNINEARTYQRGLKEFEDWLWSKTDETPKKSKSAKASAKVLFPPMPWLERMQAIETLIEVLSDVMSTVQCRDILVPTNAEDYPALPLIRAEDTLNINWLTSTTAVFGTHLSSTIVFASILEIATRHLLRCLAYPHRPIALKALAALTRRWALLPSSHEAAGLFRASVVDNQLQRNDSIDLAQRYLGLFVPYSYKAYFFLFFNDPTSLATLIRSFNRLFFENFKDSDWTFHWDVREYMAKCDILLRRYLFLLERLIENPIKWEAEYILIGPSTISYTRDQHHPAPAKFLATDSKVKFEMPSDLQPSPNDQWGAYEELHWFTRPGLDTDRNSPLDMDMACMRERCFFSYSPAWTNTRPFLGLVDSTSIPTTPEEREKTISERFDKYLTGILDVVGALSQALGSTDMSTWKKPFLHHVGSGDELVMPELEQWRGKGDEVDPPPSVTFFVPVQDISVRPVTTSALDISIYLLSYWYSGDKLRAFEKRVSSSSATSSSSQISRPAQLPATQLRNPRLLDMAWECLGSAAHVAEELPIAVLNHCGFLLGALLQIEQQTSGTLLASTNPNWYSSVLPALTALLHHVPAEFFQQRLAANISDGNVEDTSVNPSMVSLNIDALVGQCIENLKPQLDNAIDQVRDYILVKSQRASGYAPGSPGDRRAKVKAWYPIFMNFLEAAVWLPKLARISTVHLKLHCLYEMKESDIALGDPPTATPADRDLGDPYSSNGPLLLRIASLILLLQSTRIRDGWRFVTLLPEGTLAQGFFAVLMTLISTPREALSFLSHHFWRPFLDRNIKNTINGVENILPFHIMSLAAEAGLFKPKEKADTPREFGNFEFSATNAIVFMLNSQVRDPHAAFAQQAIASLYTHSALFHILFATDQATQLALDHSPSILMAFRSGFHIKIPHGSNFSFAPNAESGIRLALSMHTISLAAAKKTLRHLDFATFCRPPDQEGMFAASSSSPKPGSMSPPVDVSAFGEHFFVKPVSKEILPLGRIETMAIHHCFSNQAGCALFFVLEQLALAYATGLLDEKVDVFDNSRDVLKRLDLLDVEGLAPLLPDKLPYKVTLNVPVKANGLVYQLLSLDQAASVGGSSSTPIPFTSYRVTPFNRVVNVWFEQHSMNTRQDKTNPGGIYHFTLKTSFLVNDTRSFVRLGLATKPALDALLAHPFKYVGDVPGSIGYSVHHGIFSDGRYVPFLDQRLQITSLWPSLRNTEPTHMVVDVQRRTFSIYIQAGQDFRGFAYTQRLPDSVFEADMVMVPVLSFGSAHTFEFGPYSASV